MIQTAIPFPSEALFLLDVRNCLGHPGAELTVLFLPETPWPLVCHRLACLRLHAKSASPGRAGCHSFVSFSGQVSSQIRLPKSRRPCPGCRPSAKEIIAEISFRKKTTGAGRNRQSVLQFSVTQEICSKVRNSAHPFPPGVGATDSKSFKASSR